jgi:hypothetical protein
VPTGFLSAKFTGLLIFDQIFIGTMGTWSAM